MIIQFVKFVILWHGVHTKIHLFQVRDQEPPDDLSHRKFKVVLRGADLKALNVNIPIITSSGMGNTLYQFRLCSIRDENLLNNEPKIDDFIMN